MLQQQHGSLGTVQPHAPARLANGLLDFSAM